MASSLSGPSRKRTIRVQDGAGSARASAIDHMKRGWVPVNAKILSQARTILEHTPEKKHDIFPLVSNDLSLSLHLNSELMKQAGSSRFVDPVERIAQSSVSDLLKALPARGTEISRHDLRKISPAQSGQLQRTLVAQKTAQIVAERAGISSGDVVIGSLFVDLGRQLVAWNYPLIFSKALSLQRTGSGDLDIEIEKILGLDPRRISSQLAPQFGLSQELQRALTRLAGKTPAVDRHGSAEYSDIFNYARAFSEHLDPRNFSHRDAQFSASAEILKERIGPLPSIHEIEERLAGSLNYYSDIVSPRSRLPLSGWQQIVISSESNPIQRDALHLRIPPRIANMVSELVRTIDGAGDTVRALSGWVEQLLPGAGFTEGCVYLLSRDKERLVPQLLLGSRRDTFAQMIGVNSGSDLAQALFSATPVKDSTTGSTGSGQMVRYTAGFHSPRVDGVLVLCGLEGESDPQREKEELDCFRSVHALLEMILRKDYELHQSKPPAGTS